ncbi:hypothetical protein ABPG74_005762 [Tetrahymena malaccensis]
MAEEQNKKRNQIQLYQQQNNKISQAFDIEKQKIQESINQNKNIHHIKSLKLIQQHHQRKCQFCEFEGIPTQVYLHTKHMHKEEFMEQTKDKKKYKQCEVCKKILKAQNLDQHQLLCNIKKNSKEGAKAKNFLRKIQTKQFQGTQIESDQNNIFYDSLLSEIGIQSDENLQNNTFISSQNSTFENEITLHKQISNSELFKPAKKLKRNPSTIAEEQEEQQNKSTSTEQPSMATNSTLFSIKQGVNELNLFDEKQD